MAPEHEARTRVLYDHEREEPGRRHHAVADWGVGEDIFDRMPSRRFSRAGRRAEHHEERLDDDATPLVPGESRTIVIGRIDDAAGPFAAEAPAAVDVDTEVDEPARRTVVVETDEPVVPAGRRTVVIKGHPERLPAGRPPRPPRTAIERVGARPDRIVAYAVALGFLLVLLAVLTTGQ